MKPPSTAFDVSLDRVLVNAGQRTTLGVSSSFRRVSPDAAEYPREQRKCLRAEELDKEAIVKEYSQVTELNTQRIKARLQNYRDALKQ